MYCTHLEPATSGPLLTLLAGLGDVGGQKTLRTYWKNYFEKTDTLIWVVDATDRDRIDDCRRELAGLLLEEVRGTLYTMIRRLPDVCESIANISVLPETVRGKPPGVQEQERRARSHDRGRGARGKS